MKNIYILALLTAVFLTISVKAQDSFLSTVSAENATYLNVEKDNRVLSFKKEGESKIVPVESNLLYTATSNETWCKAEVITQDAKLVVKITTEQNMGSELRDATVTLTGKDNHTVDIDVRQIGTAPVVLAKERNITVVNENRRFTIEVTTNLEITFSYPEWITPIDVTPVIGIKEYIFEATEYSDKTQSREGEIKIQSKDNVVAEVIIPVEQIFKGYLRFAVISDTHFENNTGEGAKVKVPKALNNLVKKNLDALFVVGDLTDFCRDSDWAAFAKVFSATATVLPDTTVSYANLPVYFLMGNHDFYTYTRAQCEQRYMTYTNQPLHQYVEIKGYPFITISMSGTSWSSYSDESVEFMRASLQDASAKYPGKPIFVFTHVPPKGTVYGSNTTDGNWGTDKFNAILELYPQVIIFSGHSHYPLGDPRSIYQNKFTAINDGSTTYSEIENNTVNVGIHPEKYEYITEGVIAELDKNTNVTVERWDTYRNEQIAPNWQVNAPHNGTNFVYKNQANTVPPTFNGGATVSVTDVSKTTCKVTFPQAQEVTGDVVHHYIIEILEGTALRATFKKFSEYYLNSQMPANFTLSMSGLPSGKTMKAQVKAVDAYSNVSTPIISSDFTTINDDTEMVIPKDFPTDKLVGLWEFKDAATPGKAIIGSDAILTGACSYEVVDKFGTVRIARDAASGYQNHIDINHGIAGKDGTDYVRDYCLIMDAKLDLNKAYTSLYSFDSTADGELFVKQNGETGLAAGSLNYSAAGFVQPGWNRIVVNAKLSGNASNGTLNIYVCYPDGTVKEFKKEAAITDSDRFSLRASQPIMISGDNDRENGDLNVAQVALFNLALTDQELNQVLKAWTK